MCFMLFVSGLEILSEVYEQKYNSNQNLLIHFSLEVVALRSLMYLKLFTKPLQGHC